MPLVVERPSLSLELLHIIFPRSSLLLSARDACTAASAWTRHTPCNLSHRNKKQKSSPSHGGSVAKGKHPNSYSVSGMEGQTSASFMTSPFPQKQTHLATWRQLHPTSPCFSAQPHLDFLIPAIVCHKQKVFQIKI